MNFNQIETKRLILRPVIESDVQGFFQLDSNPNVHRFLASKPVKTITESEAMIATILDQYNKFDLGRLAVVLKDTNEFIGWSGLKYEQNLRKEFNYYDLGYRFKPQYWGKGYATESALASLAYGFNALKLEEINAVASIDHIASNIVLKKIGMRPSGTFEYNDDLCNWYVIPNKH
jgi:RimJ/RimL family protein N-acetyltransferase